MRKILLRHWRFFVFFLLTIIVGIFVYLLTIYDENKGIIDVKNNQSWLNLCSKISEYIKSGCWDYEDTHVKISVRCNNDVLFEIYPSKPYPNRAKNHYVHFLEKGILYCEIDNPIPYLISDNDQQASFFETEKVILYKWNELHKLINELKKSADKNIIISAEKDFNIQNKSCLIKKIFVDQDRKEVILYYSYIFICPHIAPSLIDCQNNNSHESFQLKMLENDLFNQTEHREELIKKVVQLCNKYPEETAYYLLKHGYLLNRILTLQ